jgi:peptide-methionine (S)-S-oxide reductase
MRELDKITLGGGCFWCIEAIYNRVRGVELVRSGYSGGTVENPTYEAVCTGATAHAEVCEIHFNPKVIKLESLLEIFWEIHDPTTLNRQGHDVGTEYRSVVYCENEEQLALALQSKREAKDNFRDEIVTEVTIKSNFYYAGKLHAHFFEINKNHPYCRFVVSPKLKIFLRKFSNYLKE